MSAFALFHLQAQRFLASVLLPKVRQDIEDNKRCHFALFQAMKKATYKPDAFFKVNALTACFAFQCTHAFSLTLSMLERAAYKPDAFFKVHALPFDVPMQPR